MTDFKDLIQKRRSHRMFSDRSIEPDKVEKILRAALMSPTSKSKRSWHFVVVEDKLVKEKLSDCKDQGAKFLADSSVCIAIAASPMENDCWVEDGSIAAFAMQMQAEELGLGSCWSQVRNRTLGDGTSASLVVKGILDIPEDFEVLCVVGIGYATDERKPQSEDRLKWENVHIGKFGTSE